MAPKVLEVKDLATEFKTRDGIVHAVNGVSFELHEGETLGIVGESACGKTVTVLSILGLIPNPPGRVVSGSADYLGKDLLKMSDEEIRFIRGAQISMVFQDPMTSFNPVLTIGRQVAEPIEIHQGVSRKEALERAGELLALVGIPNAKDRLADYPHQFSGGMRQRAMIAMALCCNPELLIADEPTTALDVTVQAQILDLIRDLQTEFGSAVIVITHDLGVVAELADDILVMYGGRCVERGPAEKVFYEPRHPYTWGLLGSMPRLDRDQTERLIPVKGSPPSLINIPSGCAFNPRCPYADLPKDDVTRTVRPELLEVGSRHSAACHMSQEQRERIWTEEIAPKL